MDVKVATELVGAYMDLVCGADRPVSIVWIPRANHGSIINLRPSEQEGLGQH